MRRCKLAPVRRQAAREFAGALVTPDEGGDVCAGAEYDWSVVELMSMRLEDTHSSKYPDSKTGGACASVALEMCVRPMDLG